MKIIRSRTHGTVDYLLGVMMMTSPWLFDFARFDAAMWTPIFIGASIIIYSFFTDYERGYIPDICLKTNLCLDGLSGIFLMISPWLFDFAHIVYLPHLILGLAGITAAIATKPHPGSSPGRVAA